MHDLDKRILTFLFFGGPVPHPFILQTQRFPAADLHPKQWRAFSHSLIEEAVGLPTMEHVKDNSKRNAIYRIVCHVIYLDYNIYIYMCVYIFIQHRINVCIIYIYVQINIYIYIVHSTYIVLVLIFPPDRPIIHFSHQCLWILDVLSICIFQIFLYLFLGKPTQPKFNFHPPKIPGHHSPSRDSSE